MSKRQNKSAQERQMEIQGARMFGKHVSPEKAKVLLVVTMIACLLPVVMGVQMWKQIPEVVETGLIGPGGKDDSLPRWGVVFLLPGLMALLNLITHVQLMVNQKRMTIPSPAVRLLGRWSFPVISVLFCSRVILGSAGIGEAFALPFLTPCILGLALLVLGAHMWDCPREAKVALRFAGCDNELSWRAVHRFAGWLWMVVGLLLIAQAMVTHGSTPATAVVILLTMVLPVVYGRLYAKNLTK